MSSKAVLRIEKPQLVKKAKGVKLLFAGLLTLLLLLALVLNLKSALLGFATVAVVWLLKSKTNIRMNIYLAVILLFAVMILLSYILHIDFPAYLLTTLVAPVVLLSGSAYFFPDAQSSAEIFYIDRQQFKCLSTKDNDYKAYSLNPFSFYKSFNTQHIKGIVFGDHYIRININDELILPRELDKGDLAKIRTFIEQHFEHLVLQPAMEEAYKSQNQLYMLKLLLVVPLILSGTAVYFFADNGRDTRLTFILLAAAALLTIGILIFFNIQKKRSV